MIKRKFNIQVIIVFAICALFMSNAIAENVKKEKDLTPKKWLEKIRDKYQHMESVDMLMQYQLYKGHNSNTMHSSYDVIYKRNGNHFYQKIANYEVIVNEDYSITIHHENGLIIVSNPAKIELFDVNIENSLKQCQNIDISYSRKSVQVSMFMHQKSNLPFARIDVFANKNSELEKIVLYYSHQTNFSDSYFNPEYDKARLEIHYLSAKPQWKDQNNILNTETYFSVENMKIITTDLFKNYQVLDYRTPQENQ